MYFSDEHLTFSPRTLFLDVEGIPVVFDPLRAPICQAYDTVPPRPFPAESAFRPGNAQSLTREKFLEMIGRAIIPESRLK